MLDKIHKLCYSFPWNAREGNFGTRWTNWSLISKFKTKDGWGLDDIHSFNTYLVSKTHENTIMKDRLWNMLIFQIYLVHDTILSYIMKEENTLKNGSIYWKALVFCFSFIGMILAWKEINDVAIRVRKDAIMGCENRIFLSQDLV